MNDNQNSVYNQNTKNEEQKFLVELFKEQFHLVHTHGDILDSKANNLLTVASTIMGIATGFFTLIIANQAEFSTMAGLLIIFLLIYVTVVILLTCALSPNAEWPIVPGEGAQDSMLSYSDTVKRYLGDKNFWDVLLADYCGYPDSEDDNKLIPGAIEKTIMINKKKAINIKYSQYFTTLMVIIPFVFVIFEYLK